MQQTSLPTAPANIDPNIQRLMRAIGSDKGIVLVLGEAAYQRSCKLNAAVRRHDLAAVRELVEPRDSEETQAILRGDGANAASPQPLATALRCKPPEGIRQELIRLLVPILPPSRRLDLILTPYSYTVID
jgi:hypothetical protein